MHEDKLKSKRRRLYYADWYQKLIDDGELDMVRGRPRARSQINQQKIISTMFNVRFDGLGKKLIAKHDPTIVVDELTETAIWRVGLEIELVTGIYITNSQIAEQLKELLS